MRRPLTQRKKRIVTMLKGHKLWRSVSWAATVTFVFEVLSADRLEIRFLKKPIFCPRRKCLQSKKMTVMEVVYLGKIMGSV